MFKSTRVRVLSIFMGDVLIDKDELTRCKIHPTIIQKIAFKMNSNPSNREKPKNSTRKWQEVIKLDDVRYVVLLRPEGDKDVIIDVRRTHYQKKNFF